MKPGLFFCAPRSFQLVFSILTLVLPMHAATPFPDPTSLPAQSNLPDPLIMFDGNKVAGSGEWFRKRRPELRELFQHYMYGTMPKPLKIQVSTGHIDKNFFGGKATKKQITLSFAEAGAPKINVLLLVPNVRRGPAP